jgi:hypothetical protein
MELFNKTKGNLEISNKVKLSMMVEVTVVQLEEAAKDILKLLVL